MEDNKDIANLQESDFISFLYLERDRENNRKPPINDVYSGCPLVVTFASKNKSHDDKGRSLLTDSLL